MKITIPQQKLTHTLEMITRVSIKHVTLPVLQCVLIPNDIVVEDRKLAGVLAQRGTDGSVVVGVGLNLKWAPDGAARVGDSVEPAAILAALLGSFDALPTDIHDRYRRALVTLGQHVRVELPTGQLSGMAIDVEHDGRLVVLDECAVSHRIDVGDIVHLRPG